MRAVMVVLATIVMVSAFGMDRLVPSQMQAAEQAAGILARAREALGGEPRLAGVTTLTAEALFRRTMGPREMDGTITLSLGVPDRIRHEEDMRLPGGGGVARVSGMNGDHVWEDVSPRGGMGPGQIIIRGSGPSLADRQLDPDQRRERQQRRLAALYERLALALLASGDDLSYAGVAEAGDDDVHVLEKTDRTGHLLRLLVSRDTHIPIAISYMEVRPGMGGGLGMMGAGRPGGSAAPQGGRAQAGRQVYEPPPSTVIMHLVDYRAVDGIQLPHLFVFIVDGEPAEEWTITKYQVNVPLRAEVFDRK